jgi:4-alpha-glucanotransferase
MTPAQGAYVHYATDELLGIVALESHRAGAVVVGEDLGTVEKNMQKQLAAHDILSYRLVWFERGSPARYRRLALAAVTNHDLPTVAGLWNGTDLKEQQRLNLQPNVEGLQEIRSRLQKTTELGDDAPAEQVVERAYRLLAKAPSAVLLATLDDALAVSERPNLPGTTFERPNWSLALPASLESLEKNPLPHKIAAILSRNPRR